MINWKKNLSTIMKISKQRPPTPFHLLSKPWLKGTQVEYILPNCQAAC